MELALFSSPANLLCSSRLLSNEDHYQNAFRSSPSILGTGKDKRVIVEQSPGIGTRFPCHGEATGLSIDPPKRNMEKLASQSRCKNYDLQPDRKYSGDAEMKMRPAIEQSSWINAFSNGTITK